MHGVLTECSAGCSLIPCVARRQHYIEYLVGLIGQHKLDPVSIFDLGEAVLELTRRGQPPPERQPGMTDEQFRVLCVQVCGLWMQVHRSERAHKNRGVIINT